MRIIRALCSIAVLFALFPWLTIGSAVSETERLIWDLEHSYWQYVQDGNLTAYQNLWHKDFLGWPSVENAPVHKDHITDWIISQTSKGLSFRLVDFKPAAIQTNGDLVVVCYWVTSKWASNDGKGTERTIRVFHTWLKTGNDWQIVSGMSMPVPAIPGK